MDLFKGGWHPDKKGGGSGKGMGKGTSLRGDFKGVNQVAGWMGKGKDSSKEWEAGIEHHSAPLSTLKDPASFGPPPKHVHAHGPQPPSSSQPPAPSTSGYSRPSPQPPVQTSSGGLGGPVPRPQIVPQESQYAEEEEEQPAPPPMPYRADTTGLKTNNLPQPPTHQALLSEEPDALPAPSQAAGKPRLPPRLPPRQNSHPDTYTPEPPPAYAAVSPQSQQDQYVNQAAAGRLAGAGVSVPGLGIGGRTGASSPQASGTAPSHAGQMGELQARFARMGRKDSPDGPDPQSQPSSGTSWSQKQSALQTASNFRKDPSSVSLTESRDALATANNFRQRHGDQVASGLQSASSLSQKYGVSDRFAGVQKSSSTPPAGTVDGVQRGAMIGSSNGASAGAAAKRPPPPPPKKKVLQGEALMQEPPPIPHSSKPR